MDQASQIAHKRTRGETLLELGRLLGVVEGEGVEVARAPDLELGLGLATRNPRRNLLYACLCKCEEYQAAS